MFNKNRCFVLNFKICCAILILFFSCQSSTVEKKIKIERFEKHFFKSNAKNLDSLIQKYPFLFPKQYSKDIWVSFLTDSLRLSIYNESNRVFVDMDLINDQISSVFSSFSKIFTQFKNPRVITLNSLSDYDNRVIYSDSLLLISLDSYLGKNFYTQLPDYISSNMSKKHLVNDVAEKISESLINRSNDRSLLAEMIYHGKILYLTKTVTPFNDPNLIFHANKTKMDWTQANEYNIWSYFIENDFLFNTTNDLKFRFINFSPFSKFNLDIDKESPGSIGKWLGYKIVDSYITNNDTNIKEMLSENFYTIFTNSKYKPRKR